MLLRHILGPMSGEIGSWLSGPESAGTGDGYPGQRLGLPAVGSGSLARMGRRLAALMVDWLIAVGLTGLLQVFGLTPAHFLLTSEGQTLVSGVWLLLGVIAVLLAEAHEWAEAHWVKLRRRLLVGPGSSPTEPAFMPKVSVHVPCYNEPPEMVIETLDALSRLDYPDFEVLLIDNNTKDEAVWRPVEAHCAKLGPRFRFFHECPLAGFKAGALNFTLRNTDPAAQVIAVIDSDYIVEPNWLKDLVPVLVDPKIAIVQAPQDYRDDGQSAFKAMCHAEYRGFFHIGMVTRNERNAIIQHGTMTLVRRSVLDRLGGWAEWCITEDAELGLRVFEEGLEATYIPQSYGRGLMPDTFIDFKKQRFRWAYGAMQILRSHARTLFRRKGSPLTDGQRYHFLAGWLPWVADGLNLAFNFCALLWTTLMVAFPAKIDAPLAIFSVLPLSLFVFKLAKLMHLYRVRVGANGRQTIAACIAGLGLAHTIGLAVLKGLFTDNEPFFRTPKNASSQTILGALSACREEGLMAIALLLGAYAVSEIALMDSPDMRAWIIVMIVQSVPYVAAVIVSVMSSLKLPASMIGQGYRELEADDDDVAPQGPSTKAAPASGDSH